MVHAALLSLALCANATSSKGAIATAHPLASAIGASVLRSGGNAVDAAVAAAFALGVLEPESSGLGGGGFALVYVAKEKKTYVLDFREVAPKAATPTMYVRDGKPVPALSLDGPLSVGVPGAVAGYAELARRFGKKPLAELVAPAERLARYGFTVTRSYHHAARERFQQLSADPAAAAQLLARGLDGKLHPPEPGWKLVQKDLADTLRAVGRDGPKVFYQGWIADEVVAAVQKAGGILTKDDLAGYKVRDREPLEGSYRGYEIVTMPLPSSGGAMLIALLRALEPEDPRAGGYHPERFLHVMIEAEKRLFAYREGLFGDPAFNPKAEAEEKKMISPEFAKALHARIGERATPAAQIAVPRESPDTTHISVIDAEGNAVSLTTTVNYVFGSCMIAPGTGFVLNDEMDDFDAAPGAANAYGLRGGAANAPGPGKIPLSSMSPTFVFDKDGKLRLAVGAPGGSTIPTTVAQVILHVIDDQMRLDRALAAGRIHEQLHPEAVRVEPNALDAATVRALEARGHVIHVSDKVWGNAQAVYVEPDGVRMGASDPRQEGAAATP